mgnify:CR=1 FL=1
MNTTTRKIILYRFNGSDIRADLESVLPENILLTECSDPDELTEMISMPGYSVVITPVEELESLTPHRSRFMPRLSTGMMRLLSKGALPDLQIMDFTSDYIEADATPDEIFFRVMKNFVDMSRHNQIINSQLKIRKHSASLGELNQIGIALSSERDLDKLLNLILTYGKKLTDSDAGSIYLIDRDFDPPRLRFKLSQTDSRDIEFSEIIMPINSKSIAGHVAVTGQSVILDNAYRLPADAPYSINKSFDLENNYKTLSMLVVPMKDHKGEIIGVLQLINRKQNASVCLETPEIAEQETIPYSRECVDIAESLGSQAAISIENAMLYEEIKNLFHSFIKASVTAIESRDPTTSGHSERVATLARELARAVNRTSQGPYGDLHFSDEEIQEIYFAGILHDFGKIGVRERVLIKEKKLYPEELERVTGRFRYLKTDIRLKHVSRLLELLREKANQEQIQKTMANAEADTRKIDEIFQCLLAANEPSFLSEDISARLNEIRDQVFVTCDGDSVNAVEPDEYKSLSVRKGTLTPEERVEIESHVRHTYNFLNKIPWPKEMKNVPDIASKHHEMMDGSGYPYKLDNSNLNAQARIMSIADIFDALTATDRPYKKAVPLDKTLEILRSEAERKRLDNQLVDIFICEKVFQSVGF